MNNVKIKFNRDLAEKYYCAQMWLGNWIHVLVNTLSTHTAIFMGIERD